MRISDELSIIRKLNVPESIKRGNYVFYVKASYNGNIAVSSDLFYVLEKPLILIKQEFQFIGVLIILILSLIILTIFNLREHKEIRNIIKINEILDKIKYRAKEKVEITKDDLEKQLQILKADLEYGYITKNIYNKQKKKIEEKLNKLKNENIQHTLNNKL